MPMCVVKWCKSHTDFKDAGITFHGFPANELVKNKWIGAVRFERRENDWIPSKSSKICSIHFQEDDIYVPTDKERRRLNKTAVPVCTMIRNENEISLLLKNKDNIGQERGTHPEHELSMPFSKELDNNTSNNVPLSSIHNNINFQVNNLQSQIPINDDQASKGNDMMDLPQKRKQFTCFNDESVKNMDTNSFDKENSIPTKVIKLYIESANEVQHQNATVNETERAVCNTPINIPSSEIESVFNSPRTHNLKQQLKKKTLLAEKRLTKIKNLQRKNKRLLKRNITLNDVIEALKKKEIGNSNLHTALSGFTSDMVGVLKMKTTKKGRSIVKFTPAIKKFALTLNYYSPAGYKFVRRQFLSCLPHPSTISKWYQTIDGKPGFTNESFRALKTKFSQSDKKLACLIVDEMAIRQQKIFNGESIDGLVTYGPPEEMATQVYVLMLVSLNNSFKLPLGHFFINGLAAEQRCNIIKMCLTKCDEVGAEVASLTFDGCASNFATAKLLGCDFEVDKMKTFFEHPVTQKPVVVILDPCHMVKLVRNILEAKKTIIDKDGQKVQWRHLESLKYIQENIGLHFGNKITQRHLNFRNNIMNVKLATQTLSNSVATALKLCSNELKLPEFQNADATINFIEMINSLFDILNTRSLNGHDFKRPIKIDEKESCFEFLDGCFEYLRELKLNIQNKKTKKVNGQKVTEFTNTQKLLINTQSKTGFLGLMICISSFKILFTELVEKRKIMNFILPYKFSQDHIELFFGVIRNHGRCNNNPNARQFTGIYKKTLLNLELRSKFTGNCIPLEDIPILNCSSAINKTTIGFRHKLQDTEQDEKEDTLKPNTETDNCVVLSQTLDVDRLLPETVEQIVGYIGGFVVRKLQAKLECRSCCILLQADTKLYFHKLISLKDKGGLIYPSVVVFKICWASETLLRQILKININEKSLTRASNLRVLAHQCFAKIAEKRDILNALRQSNDHESCHDILLLKTVIEEFLRIRLYYMAKNESLLNSNRHKLNKLIIFRGT